MAIANLYQKAREKSSLTGILITDLIAFISYAIFPSGIVYFGDLQMVIGCIVGIRFTLKNIQSNKSYISYGIIIGLFGAILTGFSYTIFDSVVYLEILNSPITFLIVFELYFVEAIIIGLTVGSAIGGYFSHKYKFLTESRVIEEDPFYQSLIDKQTPYKKKLKKYKN